MIRVTMSSLACAGRAPAIASRIWRSRLRGPRIETPEAGGMNWVAFSRLWAPYSSFMPAEATPAPLRQPFSPVARNSGAFGERRRWLHSAARRPTWGGRAMFRRFGLFALGWALVLAGGLIAHLVQTSGGVRIEDVRYRGAAGETISALLYVPPSATAAHPAPAVLVSHGFINTREMQSPFAIELARRGFVVLAMDMTGHGYSTGPMGVDGFGGPSALAYLRSLPFVDKANIGLEGHSMGGAPIMNAATAIPDGYRAVVLEGSTTQFFGAGAPGTPTFP